jgi:hypothetical protein
LFHSLIRTLVKTFPKLSAKTAPSKPQADHFSSDHQYAPATRQAARTKFWRAGEFIYSEDRIFLLILNGVPLFQEQIMSRTDPLKVCRLFFLKTPAL